MIDPVTGWFEVIQYNNKRTISIANLVETTWLSRYTTIPMEITYEQALLSAQDFLEPGE